MSGNYFSGGPLPHIPEKRLSEGLYSEVEKNVQYACTDVTLRDPQTGKLFLGSRQTEPQLGPWFIGGRNIYDKSINQNASSQVEHDLGLKFDDNRFKHISTITTVFPVAAPGREDHGRSTMNAVMCIDLNPEEVEALNTKLQADGTSNEYSTAGWYDPVEIMDQHSDFPYAVKQFVRDLHAYDITRNAIHEDALKEHEQREKVGKTAIKAGRQEKDRQARLSDLLKIGFNMIEAEKIESASGRNAMYSVFWAKTASEQFRGEDLSAFLQELAPDDDIGDYMRRKILKDSKITPPEVHSDNGPLLKSILTAASYAVRFDKEHDGEIFSNIAPLKPAGHPGPDSQDYSL